MLFNLAASWGQPASDVMRAMPADEWPLWLAFDALTNIGPLGDDQRAGIIAAVTNNGLNTVKKDPADYFPSLRVQIRPRRPGERGTVDGGVRGFLGRMAPGL